MKKKIGVLLVAGGLTVGLLAGFAIDAQQAREMLGVAPSFISYEEYDMSIGLEPLGKPLKPRRFEEYREVLNYPAFYGDVYDISSVGKNAVIWFRDNQGTLRNAYLEDTDRRLYRIQKMEVEKYKFQPAR